jgi:signal transduction histidine kinase
MSDTRIPVNASLFRALLQRRPHVTTTRASKGTMVATSHLIEELVANSPGPCVLLSGFQHGRNWVVERDKYLELAGDHDVIAVFAGQEPPVTWEAQHIGVRLNAGDPLTQEWFVLALGPDVAVTLCGLDAGERLPVDGADPPVDDSDRLFDVVWSFSPDVAREALAVVADAIGQAAPDKHAEVEAALARVDALGPLSPELVARGADHLVAGLIDRVERSRRLERATAAKVNLAKTEFLSRMSHELRTPLNVILGFTQLMQLDGRSPEDEEGLAHVERAGRHLLELIDEVLDISKIEEGRLELELEPVAIGALVGDALGLVRPLADQRSLRVDAGEAPASALRVIADRRRLRQVLLNLLSNAVKYNVEEGELAIRIATDPDGMVRVSVRDTGTGIPPADIERIFVPFERVGSDDVEGTGLGLPIARRLAVAMGGRIEVDSRTAGPTRGSTFSVLLPQAEPEPEPETAAGARVVVYIEDNPANVRLIERAIGGAGVVVRAAPTGTQGLALARSVAPALVLLDLNLPDIHGSEVLTQLLADPATRGVPVVVVSSDAVPATADRLTAAGAAAFLTKPLDLRELRSVVESLL